MEVHYFLVALGDDGYQEVEKDDDHVDHLYEKDRLDEVNCCLVAKSLMVAPFIVARGRDIAQSISESHREEHELRGKSIIVRTIFSSSCYFEHEGETKKPKHHQKHEINDVLQTLTNKLHKHSLTFEDSQQLHNLQHREEDVNNVQDHHLGV